MLLRSLCVSVTLLTIATPALAEFYIVQDPETGKCAVVDAKPDGTTVVMIGTQSYATKQEAKTAKKASAECKKAKAKDDSAS